MSKSKFIVLAESSIQPEHLDDVKQLSEEFEKQTLTEPGCESFFRTSKPEQPTNLFFFEVYSSKEEFEKHTQTKYTQDFFSTLTEKYNVIPVVTVLTDI